MPAPPLSDRVLAWRERGADRELAGRRVFVAGDRGDDPALLFIHGFPSSSFDWRQTVELLPGRSWAAPDLLGFGLSEKPRGRAYSIFEQADIVEELMTGSRGVTVVAHDYGTSVASELLARALLGQLAFDIGQVLMLNGSMVIECASLTPGQRLLRTPFGAAVARLSIRRGFEREFARLFAPGQPLAPDEAADQWALWRHEDGSRNAHRLAAYLTERTTHAGRWHGAFADWPGELRLVWGMRDPVSTPAVLDALVSLRPSVPVSRLPDVGHYVQIERPDVVARAVDELERRA